MMWFPLMFWMESVQSCFLGLTDLYNKSLQCSIIPTCWKQALVRPILEKATLNPSQPASYRPISLLPLLGKILEALVNHQLTRYLENYKILDPSQSGFRASHSTETALVEIADNIRLSLDTKQSAILVLLDLWAAFKTISHDILVRRLGEIRIGGAVLKWFGSYLANRTYKVQLDDFISSSKPINKGVPQGSFLSPTLFNIYVAPLAKIIESFGFRTVSYADDTQLLITWGTTWRILPRILSNACWAYISGCCVTACSWIPTKPR